MVFADGLINGDIYIYPRLTSVARGFTGIGHRMLPIAFFPDRFPLPWQRNLGQNWL